MEIRQHMRKEQQQQGRGAGAMRRRIAGGKGYLSIGLVRREGHSTGRLGGYVGYRMSAIFWHAEMTSYYTKPVHGDGGAAWSGVTRRHQLP